MKAKLAVALMVVWAAMGVAKGQGGTKGASPAPVGQQQDHLSQAEINNAVSAAPDIGFVRIEDMGFNSPSRCRAQMPSESIYTPAGWLNALSIIARSQFLPFEPKQEDTLRALTVVSKGCVGGTPAGPVCDSITRAVILSDPKGRVVVEAVSSHPLSGPWQNSFSVTTTCLSLLSKFAMTDVEKARNSKGEFIIATFRGTRPLKKYTVKEKHLKRLGM